MGKSHMSLPNKILEEYIIKRKWAKGPVRESQMFILIWRELPQARSTSIWMEKSLTWNRKYFLLCAIRTRKLCNKLSLILHSVVIFLIFTVRNNLISKIIIVIETISTPLDSSRHRFDSSCMILMMLLNFFCSWLPQSFCFCFFNMQ